jgi:hypothetical protein
MQDAGNADASGCKIITDLTSDTNTCTITVLAEKTSYNVLCTAVEVYNGWPTHMLTPMALPSPTWPLQPLERAWKCQPTILDVMAQGSRT